MTETPRTDAAKRHAKLFSIHSQQMDDLAAEMAILERENAALREDKARLDWLDELKKDEGRRVFSDTTLTRTHIEHVGFSWILDSSENNLRSAIDAARRASP